MFRVCVDIGGTFTDCVVLDDKGNLEEFKAPSTPADFSLGVIYAVDTHGQSPWHFIIQASLDLNPDILAISRTQ